MGKKLKPIDRIRLQAEMDKVNGIVNQIEIKDHVDQAFYRIISPLLCIFLTSDYLVKIAQIAGDHKEQIRILRMDMFTYENRYVYGHLSSNHVDVANDLYHAGKKRGLALTDYAYIPVRCHFNSFGVIEWHGEKPLSAYQHFNPYTTLSEEAGRRLVDEITYLAKKGFWIPAGALYYCPETEDVKLFYYSSVKYLGIPKEENLTEYLDSYREIYEERG